MPKPKRPMARCEYCSRDIPILYMLAGNRTRRTLGKHFTSDPRLEGEASKRRILCPGYGVCLDGGSRLWGQGH